MRPSDRKALKTMSRSKLAPITQVSLVLTTRLANESEPTTSAWNSSARKSVVGFGYKSSNKPERWTRQRGPGSYLFLLPNLIISPTDVFRAVLFRLHKVSIRRQACLQARRKSIPSLQMRMETCTRFSHIPFLFRLGLEVATLLSMGTGLNDQGGDKRFNHRNSISNTNPSRTTRSSRSNRSSTDHLAILGQVSCHSSYLKMAEVQHRPSNKLMDTANQDSSNPNNSQILRSSKMRPSYCW